VEETTIRDIQAAYLGGKLTCVQLVQAYLIDIGLRPERACLECIRQAQSCRARGGRRNR